jgi:dTDP-4-dehydrorhamnose 3,5-epimerase
LKQVNPGPEHSTIVHLTAIEGAYLMSVPSVHYEFGFLSEIINKGWDSIYDDPFEHLYFITNDNKRRSSWHVHLHTVDRYTLLNGNVDVALYDNRPDSETHGVLTHFTLSPLGASGFHSLKIPAGVWHTFRCTSESFTLMNSKYPKYDRLNPDKYDIPLENDTVTFSWEQSSLS